MHPLTLFLWVSGLVWLLCAPGGKRFRFIGITYLVFLAMVILLHSKDYYVAPIYPVLFAAGGPPQLSALLQIGRDNYALRVVTRPFSTAAFWGLAKNAATSPQAAAKDSHSPGTARFPVR